MIDVKKILYKKKQIIEARNNALIAINTVEERHRRISGDVNWFIRGTAPSDPVFNEYAREEETVSRIEHLRWIVSELNIIIDAVTRAAKTLNDDQRELIELRYFDDNSVVKVCDMMHIKDTKYNYTHRIALEAMTACLNPLCITEQHLDSLLFAPYKERLKTLGKPRKIQDFERLLSGF